MPIWGPDRTPIDTELPKTGVGARTKSFKHFVHYSTAR